METRRRQLNSYLAGLLQNQLIHHDDRCSELVYWFLHPTDNFRQFMRRTNVSVTKLLGYAPPVFLAKKLITKVNLDGPGCRARVLLNPAGRFVESSGEGGTDAS